MAQVTAPEVEQPEKKTARLIPEERLKEILNILLPYGYSHYYGTFYTGVSPYIGKEHNVITIVANDPVGWGSVFAICMEHFTEEEDDDKFKDVMNVLDFNWAEELVQDNRFPVKVEFCPETTN